MGEENDFTRRVERIATGIGIEAKCRLMHREGFEDDGEWFPPYDDYEVRSGGCVLTLDARYASLDTDVINEMIAFNLEHAFKK